MFCHGETPAILADVLDKCRNKPPEFPKSTIVQIRSTIQGLLERVSKLEDNQSKSAKTIQIFKKTIADLQTKNNSLQTENDQLRDRFNAHATSCETARKNTNSTIKRLEGLDYTEYQVNYEKSTNDLSKMSKLCASLQKQINDTKAKVKTLSAQRSTPLEKDTQAAYNGMSRATDHTHEPLAYKATCAQPSVNKTVDRPVSQGQLTATNHANNYTRDSDNVSFKPGDTHVKIKQIIKDSEMISKSKTANHAQTLNLTRNQYVQSENCPIVPDSSAQISPSVLGQTKQNSAGKLVETFSQLSSSLTDKLTNSTEDDIFEGVTYKRNARYYLSGIGPRSTQSGMLNFLRKNGIHVSHCVFFKPKREGARRNAKINVALCNAQTIESSGFWPKGISCRPWLSRKQWDDKIARENTDNEKTVEEENWEITENDDD